MAPIGCPACGKTIDSADATCRWCGRSIAEAREALSEARQALHRESAGDDSWLTRSMTGPQQQLFHAEMADRRKSRGTAIALALLLGGVGAHHFYLRNYAAGIVYAIFCWTWIPMILGLVEAFLVGGRVDRFNLRQAELVAARIRVMTPGPPPVSGSAS